MLNQISIDSCSKLMLMNTSFVTMIKKIVKIVIPSFDILNIVLVKSENAIVEFFQKDSNKKQLKPK